MGVENQSPAGESNENRKQQSSLETKTNLQSKQREKPNGYETVPEAPAVTRQILISTPYNAYKDVVDANEGRDGTKKNAPAVFSVIDSTLDGEFIQVSDGKETFWINGKESKANDWNIHMGYLTNIRGTLRLAAKPLDSRAAALEIPVSPQTFFPAFEQGDGVEDTLYIGMDFEAKTKELSTKPLWTNKLNREDQKIGECAILATELDLKKFVTNLKFLHESMALLSPTERRSAERILDATQKTMLQLCGINVSSLESEKSKSLDYAQSKGFKPDILVSSMDDISRMDDKGFEQWLSRLRVCQKRYEELLAGRDKKMEKTVSMDGKETRCFIISLDDLP